MSRVNESGTHTHLAGIEGFFATAQAMSNDYLKPSKRLLADIFATKKCLPRAIEMANQLYLNLEGKGHKVGFSPVGVYFHRPDLNHCDGKNGSTYSWDTWHPARPTLVFIGTMPLGLTVFELSEKAEAEHRNGKWIRVSDIPPPKNRRHHYEPTPWTTTHEFPTGRLGVKAYSPYADVPWERKWVEPEEGVLPGMFEEISKSLKIHASRLVPLVREAEEKRRIEREAQEAKHREWLKQRAIEEEAERLAKAERARLKAIQDSKQDLLDLFQRWDRAKRVQAFLTELESLVDSAAPEKQAFLKDRLTKAREFLGKIDVLPLVSG